jgi:endonuclease/exonuclease/phosphatase family metal-dependent hydrolase
MKNLFRLITKKTAWVINIVLAILLLSASLLKYISPAKFWPMGFLGLIVPFLAIVNVAFILFWLIFKKYRRLLLSLIALATAWPVIALGFAINKSTTLKPIPNSFTVMSYNVRLLNYYNWSKDKDTRNNLLSYLQNTQADILCMQEFFSSLDSAGIQNVDDIAEIVGYEHLAANKNFVTKRGFFGDIIYSKWPIINAESVQFENNKSTHLFHFADIVIQADTFRVYNLHLQSVHFSQEDKQTITATNKVGKEQFVQGKIIAKKLKSSYIKRSYQADLVAKHISTSPYPVIVCGDFNDMPSSYAYLTIRGLLNDAFLDCGSGIGTTYNNYSPLLRIDNIFYPCSKLKCLAFNKTTKNYSDHYPIIAQFINTKIP